MPWWSWLLIWGVLVLGLLGMLVWFAIRLFGKLMTASDALAELGDHVADAFPDADPFGAPAGVEENLLPKVPAIFQNVNDLAFLRAQNRADTARHRQERRDERVRRGKLLSHTPTS